MRLSAAPCLVFTATFRRCIVVNMRCVVVAVVVVVVVVAALVAKTAFVVVVALVALRNVAPAIAVYMFIYYP